MRSAASIEKIVVRGTNWIGDAVISVPALRELSRLFPEAEIVLHTKDSVEGLFEDVDFIDRILPFEKRSSRIKQTVAQADILCDNEFDLAILFPNSFESALTTSLARIPRRIGYNKDLRGLLLTEPVAVPEWKDKRHEVYYYLNLIAEVERRFLGTSTVGGFNPDISLSISKERQQKARQRLQHSGIDLSKPIVAIGAGSTNSMAKRWGTSNFSGLAERLHNEFEAQLFLVGASSEADVAYEIKKTVSFPLLDLTGTTNIAEAAAILSVADLLISNDMGLAHVAPAVGTRTAVIFGPTNPVTTRPFSDQAVVIRHDVECSPCMLRECPIDHRCMTGVSVERVLDACRSLLVEPLPTE
ncbi:MAG TPA: lipopolysaccharide heptosyltransferase II [Pyrinomonadaceae bacterium]|nr:lipopolysaccharide heptosyltransferase II [Pyrinomonadaceae bacterium]